ncbi:hypothetical protein UCDDA912_g09073 [Diaporthe ampelina]|uniref:Clr5 domain-containing protein n=1 Tax=Diaporthe ampelina TaxID=1214573 RepID=A0A0G2F9V5_9PEZI|nr:hypothetical protein UCDDA912_g09073 [Diaporthe ampelina]
MPIVKRLYIDEGKKLREVMDTMARDYNFVASSKMYKVRMKQWGYSKNIRTTPEDVGSLMKSILNRIFAMVVHLLNIPEQQQRVGRIIKALVNYAAAAAAEPDSQKAADFGEESPEAVVELFFLTELERQRVEARGGSKDYLKSLLTLTLQRIPEGECQIAKLNCELYMAEIAKEESDRELAEAYLRAAIDTRVKRGGAKALLFQKLTKLESWLTEWGEVAKVAELQPWKESVRASMNDGGTT